MTNDGIARLAFYGAYCKLLHAEATVIGMALDSDARLLDMLDAHNVIEAAKQAVVVQYLKVRVI